MVSTLKSRNRRVVRSSQVRAVMEALEARELFSADNLLGIGGMLGKPSTSVKGAPGSLTYTAATHSFDAVATPVSFQLAVGSAPIQIQPPQSFDLHIKVDSNGNLIAGTSTNTDLVVTGSIDVNNDGVADYTGTLLTGKILAFGHQDDGSVAPSSGDQFDFRFQVTGGALAATYFTGQDAGVAFSVEQSTFTGDFSQDFSALTKGMMGPIPTVATPPGVIFGHKYQDQTGNGLSADDKTHGVAGFTINLYSDANGNGKVDGADAVVASTVTAADGSYSFTGVAAGNYTVSEVQKTGWVETGPTSGSYSVNVTAGSNNGPFDFDNWKQDDCLNHISCISYTITSGCTTKTYSSLDGHVHQGDTVKVNFTLDDTETFTLVAYTAPDATFNANDASQQKIFSVDTETLGKGMHSLTVTIPNCYFQVDFVCGAAIDQFGPAGSNIFYHQEGRFVDSDNGGTNACGCGTAGTGSISGQVICDCNNNGKLDYNESGIKGVTLTLTGNTTDGMAVSMTTMTDANGNYSFGKLKAGTYTVTETQPLGTYDGKDSAGSVGGTVGNDVISNIVIGNATKATAYNFAELAGAKISGTVYNDTNKDGSLGRNETGIAGVKVTISGTDDQGNAVSLSTMTDSNGNYSFSNLRKGTYTLTETVMSGYVGTKNMAGSNGGTVGSTSISNICLNWCDEACNYNFGEQKPCTPATPPVCTPPVCTPPSTPSCGSSYSSNPCSNLINAIISLISAFLSKC